MNPFLLRGFLNELEKIAKIDLLNSPFLQKTKTKIIGALTSPAGKEATRVTRGLSDSMNRSASGAGVVSPAPDTMGVVGMTVGRKVGGSLGEQVGKIEGKVRNTFSGWVAGKKYKKIGKELGLTPKEQKRVNQGIQDYYAKNRPTEIAAAAKKGKQQGEFYGELTGGVGGSFAPMAFDRGGITRRPTRAILSKDKDPEAVIPLGNDPADIRNRRRVLRMAKKVMEKEKKASKRMPSRLWKIWKRYNKGRDYIVDKVMDNVHNPYLNLVAGTAAHASLRPIEHAKDVVGLTKEYLSDPAVLGLLGAGTVAGYSPYLAGAYLGGKKLLGKKKEITKTSQAYLSAEINSIAEELRRSE